MDPFVMCRRARAIGLDGVVITEHDWLWTETELDVLRQMHPDLVILAGIEVSAYEGHFLVYGVDQRLRPAQGHPRGRPVRRGPRPGRRRGGRAPVPLESAVRGDFTA